MVRTLDIAWLGGLLEGEGYFGFLPSRSDRKSGTPVVVLRMTDRDTVERVAGLFKRGVSSFTVVKKPTHKPTYSCRVVGSAAIAWMMTVYQFLGNRRQETISGIIGKWRQPNPYARAPRGMRSMAECHPDRPATTRGLCSSCHSRLWRKGGPVTGRRRNGLSIPTTA